MQAPNQYQDYNNAISNVYKVIDSLTEVLNEERSKFEDRISDVTQKVEGLKRGIVGIEKERDEWVLSQLDEDGNKL